MKCSAISRFLSRQSGGATVETVLWFPLIMAVFGMMFDTAMVLHGRETVLRVIQEANRERAVGRLATNDATEDYVEGYLAAINITASATTTRTAGVVTTTVSVPAAQLQALGFYTAISGLTFSVSADQMIENWEV